MQDEWFHVPQTQRYCKGDLEHWDPKITTFPGLYLLAAPYAKAITLLQTSLSTKGEGQEPCSTGVLRSFNVVMAAVFFAIVNQLYRRLHLRSSRESPTLVVSSSNSTDTGAHHRPQQYIVLAVHHSCRQSRYDELTSKCYVQALLALLLPTHFLYAFLYYTDIGAATSLLASYLVGPMALSLAMPCQRQEQDLICPTMKGAITVRIYDNLSCHGTAWRTIDSGSGACQDRIAPQLCEQAREP